MKLSVIGEIADKYWLEIPEHFPFVKLDAHVVMPNHVHGIVIIDKTDDNPKIGQNDERKQGLQNMQGAPQYQFRLAIPFPRPYYPKERRISTNKKIVDQVGQLYFDFMNNLYFIL